MQHTKYRTSLIATVFLLLAAGVTGAPTAGAVLVEEVEYDGCEVDETSGECSFECKPGFKVFVRLDGSGSIEARCGSSKVASCSGGDCEGSGRNTYTSARGSCEVDGEGTGTCWIGERLPDARIKS